MSMFLSKLKLAAAVALTASAVVVTGAGVIARQADAPKPGAPAPPATTTTTGSAAVEIGPGIAPAAEPAPAPPQAEPVPPGGVVTSNGLPRQALDVPTDPFRATAFMPPPAELAARLKMAQERRDLAEARFKTGQLSRSEFAEAAGGVTILEGQIDGLIETLRDEMETLLVQVQARKADLAKAQVQTQSMQSKLARTQELAARAVISTNEVYQAKLDLEMSQSDEQHQRSAVQEFEVRIRQVERKLTRLAALRPSAPATEPRSADPRPAAPTAVDTGKVAGDSVVFKDGMSTVVYAVPDLVGASREHPNQADYRPLIELIESSVAPGTWHPGGVAVARFGSIRPAQNQPGLIILQTPEVQQQVAKFLDQLRKLPALRAVGGPSHGPEATEAPPGVDPALFAPPPPPAPPPVEAVDTSSIAPPPPPLPPSGVKP